MLQIHFSLTSSHIVWFSKLKQNYIVNREYYIVRQFYISLLSLSYLLDPLSSIFYLLLFFLSNFFIFFILKSLTSNLFISKDYLCKIQIEPQIQLIVTDLPSQTIDIMIDVSQQVFHHNSQARQALLPSPFFYRDLLFCSISSPMESLNLVPSNYLPRCPKRCLW